MQDGAGAGKQFGPRNTYALRRAQWLGLRRLWKARVSSESNFLAVANKISSFRNAV